MIRSNEDFKHLYCRRTKEKVKDKLLKYSKIEILQGRHPVFKRMGKRGDANLHTV